MPLTIKFPNMAIKILNPKETRYLLPSPTSTTMDNFGDGTWREQARQMASGEVLLPRRYGSFARGRDTTKGVCSGTPRVTNGMT
jgi:hypothetical protein